MIVNFLHFSFETKLNWPRFHYHSIVIIARLAQMNKYDNFVSNVI